MAFPRNFEVLAKNAALALALLALTGIAAAAPANGPQTQFGPTSAALRAALEGPKATHATSGAGTALLRRFYGAREFRPAWIDDPVAERAVVTAIRNAGADGLVSTRYALPMAVPPTAPAAALAHYDLALTNAVLRYAHDLRRGEVDPARADKLVGLTRPPFDPASSLSLALANRGIAMWLANLAPVSPEYGRLKAALVHYRAIAAAGGWSELPAVRKIELQPGNPLLVPLEHRLAMEDPELAKVPDPLAVPVLEAAIKRYQTRNGLESDGVVGRKTIAALNVPAADRVTQIEANMERWLWLPHRLPVRYIAVNAADATLKVVDDGKTILTSRVIVGKRRTQTAIFNADVIAVTINPPWKVPTSIVRNEILPKLRRNPDYLVKHHMVEKGAPYRIEQLPGAYNSLGYLKLEMPNRFSMFLHDTNARGLFARDDRHLSHGCIRVQNIRPLAAYALTGDSDLGLARINDLIESGKTQKIPLSRPLPVYVLYWTVIAHADGVVDFRPDVYGRDKRLITALVGQRR